MPEAAEPEPQGENIALNVVYEDEDIIVIDKPPGLVVHPAAGHASGTLVNALIAHCGTSLSGIGGERRPGIVHRLDKDTTGLMVVAKNDLAHRALAAQFADHGRSSEEFERGYLAFAWGAPDRPHGVIDRPIDRDPRARDRMAIREGGREAVTHWQLLEGFAGVPGPRRIHKNAKSDAPATGAPAKSADPKTASPTLTSLTPSPTASTVPETSNPIPRGRLPGNNPRHRAQSAGLRPQAATRTRIRFAAGPGSSVSSSRSTSRGSP